jgi:hypothetical protein
MPPIAVYRIGDIHFVRDGHHRVAGARAQGRDTIEALVVEVATRVGADTSIRLRRYLDRAQIAWRWFEEEYVPVVAMLRVADLLGRHETETDAYTRLTSDRYRLRRTQEWSDEAIDRVRRGR